MPYLLTKIFSFCTITGTAVLPSSSGSTPLTAAIAGGVGGALFLGVTIALAVIAVKVCGRRRRRMRRKEMDSSTERKDAENKKYGE